MIRIHGRLALDAAASIDMATSALEHRLVGWPTSFGQFGLVQGFSDQYSSRRCIGGHCKLPHRADDTFLFCKVYECQSDAAPAGFVDVHRVGSTSIDERAPALCCSY